MILIISDALKNTLIRKEIIILPQWAKFSNKGNEDSNESSSW